MLSEVINAQLGLAFWLIAQLALTRPATPKCTQLALQFKEDRQMTIDERIEFLMQSTESHDRQIGELTDKMASLTTKVDILTTKFDALGGMMAQLLEAMKTLAETVTHHERRITGLEGQAG